MKRAACQGMNPVLFDSISVPAHLSARRACDYCPMSESCLRLALKISSEENGITLRGPHGTWGGLLWERGQIQTVTPPTAQETLQRYITREEVA